MSVNRPLEMASYLASNKRTGFFHKQMFFERHISESILHATEEFDGSNGVSTAGLSALVSPGFIKLSTVGGCCASS
jgi:hypothetical protein